MNSDRNLVYSPKELFNLSKKTASVLSNEHASSFAKNLPDVRRLSLCELEPSLLPVVNSIKSIGAVSENTSELVEAIKIAYEYQAWRQPYSEKDIGATFTNGSAWFPIADVDGPVVYTEGLMEIMILNGE